MYQRRGYVRSTYASQSSQSQSSQAGGNYRRYAKYKKSDPTENTALKMFKYLSNDTFNKMWEANYQVITIGDLFLGFGYGRPIQWLLHWKSSKAVCDGIYEKLSRLKDKMDFRPFQYIGINNDEYPRWRVNYIPDIISVLDWARLNTKEPNVGQRCSDQILALQVVLHQGRMWGGIEDYENLIGMHTTYVYWSDESQREVQGQVFPSTFWWLRDHNAVFLGETGNTAQLAVINDTWNATSEVIRDKNTPTFIEEMDRGRNTGIVRLRQQPQPQGP
jgi:hypothetical protein